MEVVAERSKMVPIELIICLVFSLALFIRLSDCLLSGGQENYSTLMLIAHIISVIGVVGSIYNIIGELRRPDVLVYRQNDYLNIYYKKQWYKEQLKNIVGVDFINDQSGRSVLKRGLLIIKTEAMEYDVSRVKNVKQAYIKITNILYALKEANHE